VYEFDEGMVIKYITVSVGNELETRTFKNELSLTEFASLYNFGPPSCTGCLFPEQGFGVILMSKGTRIYRWTESVFRDLELLAEEMHKQGIWHQDLHYGNVMMFNGKLRIIDFGAAMRFRDGITGSILQLHDKLYFYSSIGNLRVYTTVCERLINCKETKSKNESMKNMIKCVEDYNLITSKGCTVILGVVTGAKFPLDFIQRATNFYQQIQCDDIFVDLDELLVLSWSQVDEIRECLPKKRKHDEQ
jgi:predicted unusual protein kinase regulating ubiquinone biosynthesis (AarF/ABC1/UbiB family)